MVVGAAIGELVGTAADGLHDLVAAASAARSLEAQRGLWPAWAGAAELAVQRQPHTVELAPMAVAAGIVAHPHLWDPGGEPGARGVVTAFLVPGGLQPVFAHITSARVLVGGEHAEIGGAAPAGR